MDLACLYKCVETEVTVCLVFTLNGREKKQTIEVDTKCSVHCCLSALLTVL